MSDFDTQAHPFKAWLRKRQKQGRRDAIDALAKKLLADTRIPLQGSKALYVAQLRAKGYSSEDIATFTQAWEEMRGKPVVNQNTNEAMSVLYGPGATHSEYSRFTNVRYREAGSEKAGQIIWICAAASDAPMLYVVEPAAGGFPEFIPQGDIIGEVE